MIKNLFLSVGAMKAGTTWLYEQLKNHPDIYFTPEKEIHYYANKVGIENQLNHRKRILKLKEILEKMANGNPKFIAENVDDIYWYANYARVKDISNKWYESLFSLNTNKKYCADFSNLYCQMGNEGWKNVFETAENVRVIYTLRDPLKRLWSHYKFHMKWIRQEDKALEVGFEHFKDLLDKDFFWINAEYVNNYINLKQNLKDDELMLLYFEDFRKDPKRKLQDIQDFLGIKNISISEEHLNKKINKTKDFKMPKDWENYAKEKLKPVYEKLIDTGIWHSDWSYEI